jgi:hypothetical protein
MSTYYREEIEHLRKEMKEKEMKVNPFGEYMIDIEHEYDESEVIEELGFKKTYMAND